MAEEAFINGAKLRQLRKSRGLTQPELGDILNCSPQAVCKWERERAKIKTSFLSALARFFGVPMEELLKNKDDINDSLRGAQQPATSELRKEEWRSPASRGLEELLKKLAERDLNIPLLLGDSFSESEIEILAGAFHAVTLMREAVKAERDKKITSIDARNQMGVENRQHHVG